MFHILTVYNTTSTFELPCLPNVLRMSLNFLALDAVVMASFLA